MKKYIMAMDEGTTSARCVIYDKQGNTISSAQREFPQYFPKEGWVEHDATEIWATQISVAQEAMLKLYLYYRDSVALGITYQLETTVVWDKVSG